MAASDGMKELDGFRFGIKTIEELQPKDPESHSSINGYGLLHAR